MSERADEREAAAAPPTLAQPVEDEAAENSPFGPHLGAHVVHDTRCEFRVWAPRVDSVELHVVAPDERRLAMNRTTAGYHEKAVDHCPAGTLYFFTVNGVDRPDPASRLQPQGVHGPSEVLDARFAWHDEHWSGIPLEDHVVYELHVGTFTPEGTFDAVVPRLDELKELGITAVELLPVAQFPGTRNWGYDGVYIHAVQKSYGGPLALKRLVDECHRRGLAILLDAVYNHLGPEGNYLSEFAPYFTDRYRTPWGPALNFDGAHSDHVRWFFIHSALQWIDEFHFDGLRIDAVHAIVDHSAQPFLQDLCDAVRDRATRLRRRIHTIAESDLNDPRVITPKEKFGLGFDSQWSDDYHHSLHALLTGESSGYYNGFGRVSDLARVIMTGYRFTGQHSPYRERRYGLKPNTNDGAKFVVCAQNHDQIGNRMLGERLSSLVSPGKLRIAAAAVVLAPFIPMLFMGEEYGEKAPFQYFTSHADADLIEAVRKGRRDEFEGFAWQGEAPDPHAEETFARSKLDWSLVERDEHAAIRDLYRHLLAIRRGNAALRSLDLAAVETCADEERRLLLIRRRSGDTQVLIAFHFGGNTASIEIPFPPVDWRPLLDTEAKIKHGQLTLLPESFALFEA